jgi:hypothetical protein
MFPIQSTTLFPRRLLMAFPFLVCIVIMFIVLANAEKTSLETFYLTLIPLTITALIWLGRKKVQLIIDNDGITYKTIFKEQYVPWKDINKTHLKYEHHVESGGHYWFFNTSAKPLKFFINLYSRKNLQIIAQAVVEKCKHSAIEERIYNMAEGRFPWYIF